MADKAIQSMIIRVIVRYRSPSIIYNPSRTLQRLMHVEFR
jgi:hypothetical protein